MRVRDAAMASELDNVHHLSAESEGALTILHLEGLMLARSQSCRH